MPPDSPAQFVDRLPAAFREWLAGRRIEEVECVISDIAGISRGKAMPFAKFIREDRMFLPTSVFHQTIAGDYVDMEIANQWTESDMVLKPGYGDWGWLLLFAVAIIAAAALWLTPVWRKPAAA